MAVKKKAWFLVGALLSTAACIFQIIGFIRYLSRLPEDWFGIALYVAAIAAFAVGALGFFVQYRKEKTEGEND